MTDDIRLAAERLRAGDAVAFPTETVYGLGADATNVDAVAKIFALKGRPSTNPLIVHVPDVAAAETCVTDFPKAGRDLAAAFWPGPLTIVLSARETITRNVTAGGATVGIRVPDHPLALALLRETDRPVAAPSANRSTRVSPTTAAHVRAEFPGVFVLDGGPCGVGIESTVLDLSTAIPRVLRPGSITAEQIADVLDRPVAGGVIVADPAERAASPGQHSIHYAPLTPAFRFDPADREQLDLTDAVVIDLNLSPETYARTFYARLRLLDSQQLSVIYIEFPPDAPAWRAVRDRIRRATKPFLSDG